MLPMTMMESMAAWKFLAVYFLFKDRTPLVDSFKVHIDGGFRHESSDLASTSENFAESSKPEHGTHFRSGNDMVAVSDGFSMTNKQIIFL
mmetsp:Transcript_40669/g.41243  ORF Transcript_40669/g.41243 Transcript_40669/m.41243 type:complete len:90 (-) Transcript_40669:83-352(-)